MSRKNLLKEMKGKKSTTQWIIQALNTHIMWDKETGNTIDNIDNQFKFTRGYFAFILNVDQ